jgi:hypothetical protein
MPAIASYKSRPHIRILSISWPSLVAKHLPASVNAHDRTLVPLLAGMIVLAPAFTVATGKIPSRAKLIELRTNLDAGIVASTRSN